MFIKFSDEQPLNASNEYFSLNLKTIKTLFYIHFRHKTTNSRVILKHDLRTRDYCHFKTILGYVIFALYIYKIYE